MKIEKNNATIQSLQIGISILDFIYQKGSPQRFTEIQEATGIKEQSL